MLDMLDMLVSKYVNMVFVHTHTQTHTHSVSTDQGAAVQRNQALWALTLLSSVMLENGLSRLFFMKK